MDEPWIKKFSVGTFISVLFLVVSLVPIRYNMLQKSSEPNGLDGYFYALQAKSLVQTGHLENPSLQCGYYLCGLCSYFTGDPIKGVKLWSAISSIGISIAIYLLLGFATGSFYPAIMGFLLSAASPTVTQMGVNYINNQTGLMFLLFYVTILVILIKKHPKSFPGKIALYSGALILFVLSALSHKITLVFACLVTLVFALPLFIRLLKNNPSISLAVKIISLLLFLAALIPAYRFFRLHSPRFANAFSLPSLPYFNATMKRILGWAALEMSIHAVLIYILAIIMLVKKRPGRFLLFLVPALFFPFWNLDSDMGLRLWMNAIPLGIPLLIFIVIVITKPDQHVIVKPNQDAGRDQDVIAGCDHDVIAGCDHDVIAGLDPAISPSHAGVSNDTHSAAHLRPFVLVSYILLYAFSCLVFIKFSPDFYDPKSDPPYSRYRDVVRDIELDDDSLLIAHQPLNHVYTYHKDLKDCLNWLPNFDVPVEKLWRLAYGTSERRIREVLESNNTLPEKSDDLIRKIDFEYTLVREDLWQAYLLYEEPDMVEVLNNWYNPHEVRPDYIRKSKTKKKGN